MENKSSALQNVTHHLVASYRELFDLAAPTMQMPAHQVDLFIDQAMQRHYHSNIFRIMTSTSVNYIKRFK